MKICIQVTTNANKLVRMHKGNDLIFFLFFVDKSTNDMYI